MKFRNSRCAAFVLAAVAVVGAVGAGSTGAASARPARGGSDWGQVTGRVQPVDVTHPKLEPALSEEGGASGSPLTAARPDASGRVRVDVDGADTAGLQSAIVDAGGSVYSVAPGSIRADVPRVDLGRLSDDPRVDHVHSPRVPRPTLVSQGVQQTGASDWQAGGNTGAGVKVAIVDLGFTGLASEQAAGALPPTTNVSACGNGTSLDGSTSHGVGVAEIVHQMAPGALLYLICFDQDADLQSIVSYLTNQGVTIVNASWGTPFGRGDGSGGPGTSAAAVAAGRAAGQLWSVSSGNEGNRHYNFAATDSDNDGAVELFHNATPTSGPDSQEIYGFNLAPGQFSDIALKWDAWPVTNQEFETCVWFDSIQASNLVNCVREGQSLQPGEPVLEDSFQGLAGHSSYFLAILRVNATITPRMDLYFLGAESGLQAVTASGSITDPATSPSALAVGAYNVTSPGAVEPFSGQGPTIDGRTKPDIAGPDGVSNNVFNPFFGTSASAPHVSGAAALLKNADPTLTAVQLQTQLENLAVDAGPAGFDDQFGAGRLRLPPFPVGGPSAIAASGSTQTFVRAADGQLWQRTADGTWHGLGGILTSDPDAAVSGTLVDVFVRGADNALWYRSSNDSGTTFGSWQPLGGVLGSSPGAVSWGPNRVDVFVRGSDGALWSRAFTGTWTAWYSLGGIVSDPDVATTGVNRLYVFVRGSDNALWRRAWNGSTWSAWVSLGGTLTAGPGAVSPRGSEIDVFARGTDAALWSRTWNGSTWSGWFSLGGGLAGAPDVASPASGQLDVLVVGVDAAVWHRTRAATGTWSTGGAAGWTSFGSPT